MALHRVKITNDKHQMLTGYKQLSITDLEVLVSVVQEGSLASVARSLGVTPSKISKTIKKIENFCGVKVLQRSHAGVQLHPEAHSLLEFAQDVSALGSRLSLRGSEKSTELQLVSIAAPSYLGTDLVGAARAELEKELPQYRFQFIEAGLDQILQLSIDQRFDIALTPGKINLTKTYHSEFVGILHWGLYARKQHPISKHIDVKELSSARFIAPFSLERKNWKYGDDKGFPRLESRNVHDLVQTAAVGLALALKTDQLIYLPEILARQYLRDGRLKMIKTSGRTQNKEELYIHVHQDRVDQFFFSKIVDILSQYLLEK